VIYLSVPSTAARNANTISVLDLATASITAQFAASEPDVLAISDDSQYLYAGIDGSASVQRFILPGLQPDISIPLGADPFFGPYYALDLQVAPGAPHTTAVSLGGSDVIPRAIGGIAIFDDATARPTKAAGFGPSGETYDGIVWGSSAAALFAFDNEDDSLAFYVLSVDSAGVTLTHDYPNAFSRLGRSIHYDPGTGFVYGDDGSILNPANGQSLGTFALRAGSGPMVPDSALNTAFFDTSSYTSGSPLLESFDMTTLSPITSIPLTELAGNPQRMIRWGSNGLAICDDNGRINLIGGNFVH
jgi:hypothetical protein